MSERRSDTTLIDQRTGCLPGPTATRRGWLHICNGLDPRRDGGMVPSILGMTGALSRMGERVTIVTPSRSKLDPAGLPDRVGLEGPETCIEDAVKSAEVVHLHGLWQAQTRRGARAATEARVPYLVASHGMADPWALRQKYWKKRIYLSLVESRNLRRASCLHALSRPEIGHLRELAPWAPIGFVPNGVDLTPFDDLPPRSALEEEHPELEGKFVLLFFARLHAKKGLDLLAEAFHRVAAERPDLHLLIAGTDEGAWAPFLARIEGHGLAEKVTYLGHVEGARARRVWAASDAFVLPSYSEGFSMAILEALACRRPCLITSACYFPELAAAGGAVEVEPTPRDVTRGLRELLERDPEERAELGRNGRRLVEREYTWDRQAHRLAAIYGWLAGGGPPPDGVDTRSQPMNPEPKTPRMMMSACAAYQVVSGGSSCVFERPGGARVPVSVIVPVRNEAENLRLCLPALSWADEVFVVDSRSTDETAEVAAANGATVVQFQFNGSYPKKKNWALENLPFRNEWVLIVDADEVVLPELAAEIGRRIEADEADGYYLNSRYYFLGRRIRHCGYSECWNLRLFKHRMGRYERMPDVTGGRSGAVAFLKE